MSGRKVLLSIVTLIIISPIAQSQSENPFGTPFYPTQYSLSYDASASAIDDSTFEGNGFNIRTGLAHYMSSNSGSASASQGGDTASAMIVYSASVTFDDETSTLTASFNATGSSDATDNPNNDDEPLGEFDATLRIFFKVDEGLATLVFTGGGEAVAGGGEAFSLSYVGLQGNPQDHNFQERFESPGGTTSGDIDKTVRVGPGTYTILFDIGSEAYIPRPENRKQVGGTAVTSGQLNANVTITASEASTVVWVGGDGTFGDTENWEPKEVPTGGNIARFHESDVSPVDVTFGSEISDRAIITENVRFLNGTYTLGEGTETEPALVVSRQTGEVGSLALIGHQLNAGFTSIAAETGTSGNIGILDDGILNCSRRLTVGESGMGILEIGSTGQGRVITDELRVGENAQSEGRVEVLDSQSSSEIELTADRTSVGYFGKGTLIVDDAQVETATTTIGELFGSVGNVELKGDGGVAEWTFGGEVRVGDEGDGTLTLSRGTLQAGADDDLLLAFREGSVGDVTINGLETLFTTFGSVFVGFEGDAHMSVTGGAGSVIGGVLSIGGVTEDTGFGQLTIRERVNSGSGNVYSQVLTDRLSLGTFGRGILHVQDYGRLFGNSFSFGTNSGGNATVSVEYGGILQATGEVQIGEENPAAGATPGRAEVFMTGSTSDRAFLVGDQVFLRSGSSVVGSGGSVLRAHTRFTNDGGTVSSGVIVDAPPKQATEDVSLLIDGDFVMTSGTLEVAASGLGSGEVGIIEVTGEADIQSATIHFVFQDGFLPKTDEEIPFFMVEGPLTVGTLAFTYEGVAPGFQFDVMEENGMLMFKALNDAQPESGEPTPRPTAINPNTDINGDKIINASDLLEVMRNWHRIVEE